MPVRRMKYSEFKSEELDRSAQFASNGDMNQQNGKFAQPFAGKTVLPPLEAIANGEMNTEWDPPRPFQQRTADAETASIQSWVTEDESPRPEDNSLDNITSRRTLVALPSAGTRISDDVERNLSPYVNPSADVEARPTTASSARYSSAAEEQAEVARFVNVKKDGRTPTPVSSASPESNAQERPAPKAKAPGHLYSHDEVNRPVSPESVITSASFERGDDGALQAGDRVSIDFSEGGETPTPAKSEQARPIGAQPLGGPIISLTPASAVESNVERNVSLLTKHTKSSSSSNSTGQRLREVPSISSIGQSRSPSPQSDNGKLEPTPHKAMPVSPLRPGFGPRGASPNDPTSGRPMSFVALPRGPEGAPLQEQIDIARETPVDRTSDQRRPPHLDSGRGGDRLPQLADGRSGPPLVNGSVQQLSPALRAPSAPFAAPPGSSANTAVDGREAGHGIAPATRPVSTRANSDGPSQGPPHAHKRLTLTPSALRNEMPITPPERSPMAPLQRPVLIAPSLESDPVKKKRRESAFAFLDIIKHKISNSDSGLSTFNRTSEDGSGGDRAARRHSIEIRGPPQVSRQPAQLSTGSFAESQSPVVKTPLESRNPVKHAPQNRQPPSEVQAAPQVVRKPLDMASRPTATRSPSNPPSETKPAHQRQTNEIRGLVGPSSRAIAASATGEVLQPYTSMRDYSSGTKAIINSFGPPTNPSRASTPVSRYDRSPSDMPSPVASISRFEARSSSPAMTRGPPPRSTPEGARTAPAPSSLPLTSSPRSAQVPSDPRRQSGINQSTSTTINQMTTGQPAPLTIVKTLPTAQTQFRPPNLCATNDPPIAQQQHPVPTSNLPSGVEAQQQVGSRETHQATEHNRRATAVLPSHPLSTHDRVPSVSTVAPAGGTETTTAAQITAKSANIGIPHARTTSVPLAFAAGRSAGAVFDSPAQRPQQTPPPKSAPMSSERSVMADPPKEPAQFRAESLQQGQQVTTRIREPLSDGQSLNSISNGSQKGSPPETTPEKSRKKRFSALGLGGLLTKANAAVSDLKHMILDDKDMQGISYDQMNQERPPSSIRIHQVPPNPDWDAKQKIRPESPALPRITQPAPRNGAADVQSPPIPQPQWTSRDANGRPLSQSAAGMQQSRPAPPPHIVTTSPGTKTAPNEKNTPVSAIAPPPALERFTTQSSVGSGQLSPMVSAERRRRSSSNSETNIVSPVSARRDSSPERPQNMRASRSGHTGGGMPSVREQHQEQPYQIKVPQASQSIETDVEAGEIWEAAQARGRWLKKDASEHGALESPPQLPKVDPVSPLVFPSRPIASPPKPSDPFVPTGRQTVSSTAPPAAQSPPRTLQQPVGAQPLDRGRNLTGQSLVTSVEIAKNDPSQRQTSSIDPRTPMTTQPQRPLPTANVSPPAENGPANSELTIRLPSEAALQMVQRKYPPPASPEKQMEQHRIQHLAEYRTQEKSATAGAENLTAEPEPAQDGLLPIAQPRPRRTSREVQALANVSEVILESQEANKEMGISPTSEAAKAHSAAMDKVNQARALVQARRQSTIPTMTAPSETMDSTNQVSESTTTNTNLTATSITKTPIDKLGIPPSEVKVPRAPAQASPTLPAQAQSPPKPAIVPTSGSQSPSSPSTSRRSASDTRSPVLPEVVRFNSLSTDPRRVPKELHRTRSRDAPELMQLTQEEQDWLYAQRLQRDEEKGLEEMRSDEPLQMKATSGPMDDWSLF